jgi:hypothetical protein
MRHRCRSRHAAVGGDFDLTPGSEVRARLGSAPAGTAAAVDRAPRRGSVTSSHRAALDQPSSSADFDDAPDTSARHDDQPQRPPPVTSTPGREALAPVHGVLRSVRAITTELARPTKRSDPCRLSECCARAPHFYEGGQAPTRSPCPLGRIAPSSPPRYRSDSRRVHPAGRASRRMAGQATGAANTTMLSR